MQLNKELCRKEAALAETAALLVLKKKAQAIWGIQRKNLSDRKLAITLVDEAVKMEPDNQKHALFK